MPQKRPRFDSSTFASLVERAGGKIAQSVKRSTIIAGHHPTSGAIREGGFREFLRQLLSQKYYVGSGFAFDARDQQSRQLDVVVALEPPSVRVFESDPACLLPCEVLLAVAEVKKTLTLGELRSCMVNANSLRKLRPFGDHRFAPGRTGGTSAANKEHRCFYTVVALSSDLTQDGWPQKELNRVRTAGAEEGVEPGLIDRVVVLDRGIINSNDGRSLRCDTVEQTIFEWFVHLSNHLDRESDRRTKLDIDIYRRDPQWDSLDR